MNQDSVIEGFATFEDQLDEFDKEISSMVNDRKDKVVVSKNEKEQIDQLLSQIKDDGERVHQAKGNIADMMKEIDDEFDEIDNLLKDVESFKLYEQEPQEEHRENSQERINSLKFKKNAPTD